MILSGQGSSGWAQELPTCECLRICALSQQPHNLCATRPQHPSQPIRHLISSTMSSTCSQAELFSQALRLPLIRTTGFRCFSCRKGRGKSFRLCLQAWPLLQATIASLQSTCLNASSHAERLDARRMCFDCQLSFGDGNKKGPNNAHTKVGKLGSNSIRKPMTGIPSSIQSLLKGAMVLRPP